ncbi:hypothetical protein [Nocardiopsis sp. JB363]|uniref:hypothetical protein n=1 Tax=Nocardiopsis sp. JB363 TaxID=1434837 RepID=UPI00097B9140|nr:hypothetical protein [Nocardiopsis sp. JB363]SIO84219.1 hypothetical protein BQ8420_00785 [Nocardiopsis sp. JB363]
MSNPTIVTKLTSLFKGIFGRKDPVVTTVPEQPEKKDEAPASTTEAQESAEVETTHEAPQEQEKAAEEADTTENTEVEAERKPAEPAEPTKPAEPAEKKPEPVAEATPETPAPAATDADVDSTEPTDAAEAAKLVEESSGEPGIPATVDLSEDGSALAEELTAAEAHTTVASDEVLEKVRKGNAPAVEDLAVPTYDELTLPSIRARLRKLTIEQVRDLRAYEVAHQGRPEFIKMYDNRIAKLEAETGA